MDGFYLDQDEALESDEDDTPTVWSEMSYNRKYDSNDIWLLDDDGCESILTGMELYFFSAILDGAEIIINELDDYGFSIVDLEDSYLEF